MPCSVRACITILLLAAMGAPRPCSSAAEELQCRPLSEMTALMPFCRDVLANVSATGVEYFVPARTEPLKQDAAARTSTENVLGMATSCRLVVISDTCVEAHRIFSCLSHFPFCYSNVTSSVALPPAASPSAADSLFPSPFSGPPALLSPCRHTCKQYCEECMLDVCPCAFLPETNCLAYEVNDPFRTEAATGGATGGTGENAAGVATSARWALPLVAVAAAGVRG